MTRDDVLKRRMRASAPQPTPIFANRVQNTLDRLPNRKKRSILRFLPELAVGAAAVALICFAVANGGVGQLPGSGGPAAAGQETTPAATEPTLTPQATTQDVEPTPEAGAPLMQPVNVSSEDNGYTATVLEAGTDGYTLAMRVKVEPWPEGAEYVNQWKFTDNNSGYYPNRIFEKTESSGESGTLTLCLPLTGKRFAGDAEIMLTDELFDMAAKNRGEGGQLASFRFKFSLPVSQPASLPAEGKGKLAFGNDATLQGVYKSDYTTTYVFKLIANDALRSIDLAEGERYSNGCVLLLSRDDCSVAVVLCKGHVENDYVESVLTEEKLNLMIAASDDYAGKGIYTKGLTMLLERSGDGAYMLIVINANPNYRPEEGFTMVTKVCDRGAGGHEDTYYALQVTGDEAGPAPTPSDGPAPTDALAPSEGPAVTALPVSTPQEPGMTALPDEYLKTFGESQTDNGITGTLVEAAADGFLLYAKLEFGPLGEGVNPRDELLATINGKSSFAGSFSSIESTARKGYYTVVYRQPFLNTGGSTLSVEMTNKIKCQGGSYARFSFRFTLENWKPEKVRASGDGILFYGNKARLTGLWRSPQATIISLSVEDNAQGSLAGYYDKYINTERGNGRNKAFFQSDYPDVMNLVLCRGLQDTSLLDTLFSEAEGEDADRAYDELNGNVSVKPLFMMLQRCEDGSFQMTIVNMGPYQWPGQDMTLLTSDWNAENDGWLYSNAVNHALQIRMDD